MPDGKIVFDHTLPQNTAAAVRSVLDEYNLSYYIYTDKCVTASGESSPHSSFKEYGPLLAADYAVRFAYGKDALNVALSTPVHKFFIHRFESDKQLAEVRNRLSLMEDIYLTSASAHKLEVMPLHVDKGTGIRETAAAFGVNINEVMAVGDYDNDMPMIQSAGLGVAMGNGSAELKAAANCITAPNTEDGLAQAIEKFVLNV